MAVTEQELTLKAASDRVWSTTAQSLGMEPAVEVPEGAEQWRQAADSKIRARIDAYVADMDSRHRQAGDGKGNGQREPQTLGAPTVGTYVALDVLSFSPLQKITYPPYEPSRIIAHYEDAVIWALVFINPAVDVYQGFAIPATVQLGGRKLRVRLEQVNLTTVSNGPDQTYTVTLPYPAPSLIWVPFKFRADDPGVNPALFEANVTVDIMDPKQPYAAFATHHVSLDADPGFLYIPPKPGGQLLHNIPLRYLVFSQ
jgi:hypothetical protein